MNPSPRNTQQRSTLVLLLLLLAAGAALRVWYATGEPHINRFEDERYSLRNVRSLLATWEFQPASAYYPSPVFNLPQALALEGSERLSKALDLPALSIYKKRSFGPTAFIITRLYQAVCGVLTLWLVFLVGRRLSSPRAGLIAATLLAFMPWMIHSSGYNKPDALLVMTVLLSLHAALRALEPVDDLTTQPLTTQPLATQPRPDGRAATRRNLGRWMWAGFCVALAMSAKLTGGLAAVPLAVGALLAPGDRPQRLRRLGLLVAAGATSALAFILMNPYWRAYFFFLRGLQRDYAGRTEASRWEVPWKVASMHLDSLVLGPVLGVAALLAFAGCGALFVLRRRRQRSPGDAGPSGLPTQTQVAMLLAYPLTYVVAYAAQTAYFKPNNFLPTIPFTVLALACFLDAGLRLAEGLPSLAPRSGAPRSGRRIALHLAAMFSLLVLVVPTGWRYVYHSRVPTTLDVVVAILNGHLEPAAGQLVLMERWTPPAIPWDGMRYVSKGLSTITQVENLGALHDDVVELAAALIFVQDGRDHQALDAATAEAMWPSSWRWRVEPGLFRYRGPPMELVMRVAQRMPVQNLAAEACGRSCLAAALPADVVAMNAAPGSVISVFVLLPDGLLSTEPDVRLGLGEREEPLVRTSQQIGGVLFVSPRLRLPIGVESLRLVGEGLLAGELDPAGVQIELHQWSPSPNGQLPPDLRN